MDLIEKYRLSELFREGAVTTFTGLDVSSGAKVLVHRLGSDRTQVDLMRLVVRRLRDAPLGEPSHILDMFESEGKVYVVTDVIEAFSDLEAWLGSPISENAMQGSAPRPPNAPPLMQSREKEHPTDSTAGAGKPGAGEFTAIFQTPTVDPKSSMKPPQASGPARPEPAVPGRQFSGIPKGRSQEAPTELTQLFEAPQLKSRPSDLSAPHFSLNEPAPDKAAPGEFTQFFQPSLGDSTEPLLDEAAALSPRSPEPHEPGDLTRIRTSAPSSPLGDSTRSGGLDFDETGTDARGSSSEHSLTDFFGELSANHPSSREDIGVKTSSSTVAFQASAGGPPLVRAAEAPQESDLSPSKKPTAPPPPSPLSAQARSEALKPEVPTVPLPPSAHRFSPAPAGMPQRIPAQPSLPQPPPPPSSRRPVASVPKIPPAAFSRPPIIPGTAPRESLKSPVLPLVLIVGGLLLGVVALVVLWN